MVMIRTSAKGSTVTMCKNCFPQTARWDRLPNQVAQCKSVLRPKSKDGSDQQLLTPQLDIAHLNAPLRQRSKLYESARRACATVVAHTCEPAALMGLTHLNMTYLCLTHHFQHRRGCVEYCRPEASSSAEPYHTDILRALQGRSRIQKRAADHTKSLQQQLSQQLPHTLLHPTLV